VRYNKTCLKKIRLFNYINVPRLSPEEDGVVLLNPEEIAFEMGI
jgi:hypothetical protein